MLPSDVYGEVSRVNKITSMSICILDASLWLSEGMNSITPSHTFPSLSVFRIQPL